MNFLDWLSQTGLAQAVANNLWFYYSLLACHAIGMGVVVGTIYMLGIRILGFKKSVPVEAFDQLFRVAWAGFALNLASGLCLFTSNPRHLLENIPFLLKMTFIVLGGLLAWLLARSVERDQPLLQQIYSASVRSKILAVMSLATWTSAIVAGRIIAYTVKYY